MGLILKNLKDNRLKFNIEKSSFGQTEMNYLRFWVTRTGIQPINNSRSHSKNDATKEYQRGACMNRNSYLLQGYVDQTVTPITSPNITCITQGEV